MWATIRTFLLPLLLSDSPVLEDFPPAGGNDESLQAPQPRDRARGPPSMSPHLLQLLWKRTDDSEYGRVQGGAKCNRPRVPCRKPFWEWVQP